MAFAEDRIPACRCTAHPMHEDRRRYMVVVREERDYVVWCCRRCTEISHVSTIQVQILAYGKARARYANRMRQQIYDARLDLIRQRAAGLRTQKGLTE